MENPEEVLNSLDEFAKLKPKDIPGELEEYLLYVATTGDPVYQWSLIKCLYRQKLINVITDFYESSPIMDIPPCPNVEPFNYESMKNGLLERFDTFASAPFTIQRVSELLTTPRKQYNRVDKFMRAVEKNIWVVSTREPGHREPTATQETASMVNGVAPPLVKRVKHCKKGKSIEERIKSGHPQLIDDDDDEEEEEEETNFDTTQIEPTKENIETNTQLNTELTSVKELIDKYENGTITNDNDETVPIVTDDVAKEEELAPQQQHDEEDDEDDEEDDEDDEEDMTTSGVKITTINSLVEEEPSSSDDSCEKQPEETEINVLLPSQDSKISDNCEAGSGVDKNSLNTGTDSQSENDDETVLVTQVLDSMTSSVQVETDNIEPVVEGAEGGESENIEKISEEETVENYGEDTRKVEVSEEDNKQATDSETIENLEPTQEIQVEKEDESSTTEVNEEFDKLLQQGTHENTNEITEAIEEKKNNFEIENKMDENGLNDDKITDMIVEENDNNIEMEVDDSASHSPMLHEDTVEPMDDSDTIIS